MRTFKILVLFISVLTLSISGCKKDKPRAPSGGGGGGGSSSADCCICDVEGDDYLACEDDWSTSEWNQIMEDYDCDCSPNTAGYICDGGCVEVLGGADYNSYGACEDNCVVNCCICDLGNDIVVCEDDFSAAEWNNIMDDYDCDCSPNTAGYICDGGCVDVLSGADYSSFYACNNECGGSSGGYNCVSGDCQGVSSEAQYGTLSECQAVCGGSSSDCCDCTGIGFVCDECCDGEFDMLGESWATWLSIFESSGCNCD